MSTKKKRVHINLIGSTGTSKSRGAKGLKGGRKGAATRVPPRGGRP
mgnify:CR=1 FL=1|tara:strand:- start:358 stop:495 length:138 start_codon:yes stop_codon:yes gene_type:complete